MKEIEINDWVNVNCQLPEPNTKVLIQYADEDVHIGRIDEEGNWWIYWLHGFDRMDIDMPVTHWMELPMPFRYVPYSGSRYNYFCAERQHGAPVCLKQCDTCAKMLP
jgi:hypothetical protein